MMSPSDSADSAAQCQNQRSAVETALDVALVVMENGGSTYRADQTFQAVLGGLHQAGATAVWTLAMVTVFFPQDGQTASVARPIGAGGINLSRVSAAWGLAQRVAGGTLAPAAIPEELQRVQSLPAPYGPWLKVAVGAFTAASFSQMVGGDGGSLGLAALAGAMGQFVRLKLQARRLSATSVTLLCAILSGLVGSVGLRLGISQAEAATLIGCVGYMIPGLPLANGFVDLISQRTLALGIERMLNAAFLVLMLTLGVAMADALVP
jgi:uncharacterized membrane protein YjjP (DUF1212 family)